MIVAAPANKLSSLIDIIRHVVFKKKEEWIGSVAVLAA